MSTRENIRLIARAPFNYSNYNTEKENKIMVRNER